MCLFVDAHGQRAVRGHRPERVHDGLVAEAGEHRVVVALAGGDAAAVQVAAGRADAAAQAVAVGRGHRLQNEVERVFKKLAERLAAVVDRKAAAGRLRGAAADAEQLERAGVHDADVPAGARDADRVRAGDGVEVEAVRETAHVRKIILVEAASAHPRAGRGLRLADVAAQAVQQLGERAGVRGEVRHRERLPEVQQMHVRVVEAGADEPAAEVDRFAAVPVRGADADEPPVFDGKAVRKAVAGIDDAAAKCGAHIITVP